MDKAQRLEQLIELADKRAILHPNPEVNMQSDIQFAALAIEVDR